MPARAAGRRSRARPTSRRGFAAAPPHFSLSDKRRCPSLRAPRTRYSHPPTEIRNPRAQKQVARLGKLLTDRKVTLELSDAARAWLGRVGYDPVYGARPLKRAVQRHLQDPLADLILRGSVKDGATVRVDEGDGKLQLAVA